MANPQPTCETCVFWDELKPSLVRVGFCEKRVTAVDDRYYKALKTKQYPEGRTMPDFGCVWHKAKT